MAIAILAGLGTLFFQVPALGLAVSAMVALLSAGLILYETGKIVNGGEDNYVLAIVGLYVSIFNLFSSLLSLFGFGVLHQNDKETAVRESLFFQRFTKLLREAFLRFCLKPANASVSRKRVVLTIPGVLSNSAEFLPNKQACGTVPRHRPV